MSLTNFNQKIKELINSLTVNEFSSLSFEDYNEGRQHYWKELLEFLRSENNSANLSHFFVRDSDDIDNNNETSSVFGRIDELADLDNTVLTNLITNLVGNNYSNMSNIDLSTASGMKSNFNNYFWNESVNKLIATWLSRMNYNSMIILESDNDTDTNSGTIKTSGASFKIKDVKKANAGNNFNDNNTTNSNVYVKPWFNIDRQTYSQVRGSDAITEVLKDGSNLQFTHKNTSDWIRLLMPEYKRTVEVEDLDRNFWVIGQIITAISAYLFDDNGAIPIIFKSLIEETTQLWENVLYLWALLAMVTREPFYTKVHCEYVTLNNTVYEPYVKFDDFDKSLTTPLGSLTPEQNKSIVQSIWNKLNYLVDTYPNCNLCIVPEIRYGNYESNYYNWVSIPGVFLFDRNASKKYNSTGENVDKIIAGNGANFETLNADNPVVTFIAFNDGGGNVGTILNNYTINNYSIGKESTSELGKRLYSYAKNEKDEDGNYLYYGPFSRIANKKGLISNKYYAGARIIPDFAVSYGIDTSVTPNKGYFKSSIGSGSIFSIKFYDAVSEIMSLGNNGAIMERRWNINGDMVYNEWSSELSYSSDYAKDTPKEKNEKNFVKGIYFGELLSNYSISPLATFNIKTETVMFEPLGGPGYVLNAKASQSDWEQYNAQQNGGLYSKIKDSDDDNYLTNLKEANGIMLNSYIHMRRNDSNATDYQTHYNDSQAAEPLNLVIGSRRCNLCLSDDASDDDYWRNNCAGTGESVKNNVKKASGTNLSGYWFKTSTDTNGICSIAQVKSNQTYRGHYFEPTNPFSQNPRIDFMNPLYADYYEHGYVKTSDDFDTLKDIKSMKYGDETFLIGHITGFRYNASSSAGNIGNLQFSDKVKTSYPNSNISIGRYNDIHLDNGINTEDTNNNTFPLLRLKFGFGEKSGNNYTSTTAYRYCPYRYNSYRQTTYNVALLYSPILFPNTNGIAKYPNYRHLYIGLPIYGENENKENIIDSLAMGAYTGENNDEDLSSGIYGRRHWNQDYYYIFKKREVKDASKDWFIMYIQTYATFRPIKVSFKASYCSQDNINSNEADKRFTYINAKGDKLKSNKGTDTSLEKRSTLKRDGITAYSLAAPEKYDTSYMGGNDSSLLYHNSDYTDIRKYPSGNTKTLKRFWKDTNVSPMLARYFAIRDEMIRLLQGMITDANPNDPDSLSTNWRNEWKQGGSHFNVHYPTLSQMKEYLPKIKLNETIKYPMLYFALLRTAVINTEARFNGNIYFQGKYNIAISDGAFKEKTHERPHSHKAAWTKYRSKTKVCNCIKKYDSKRPETGATPDQGFSYENWSSNNYHSIMEDLLTIDVTELLCLNDDLNSSEQYYYYKHGSVSAEWYTLGSWFIDNSFKIKTSRTYGAALAEYWEEHYSTDLPKSIPVAYKESINSNYSKWDDLTDEPEKPDTENDGLVRVLKDLFESLYDHYDDDAQSYKGYGTHSSGGFRSQRNLKEVKTKNFKYGDSVDVYSKYNNSSPLIQYIKKPFDNYPTDQGYDYYCHNEYSFNKHWWHCSANKYKTLDRKDLKVPAFITVQNNGYSKEQCKGSNGKRYFEEWLEKMRRLGPKGKPGKDESLIINGPMNLDTETINFSSYGGSDNINTYNSKIFNYSKNINISEWIRGIGVATHPPGSEDIISFNNNTLFTNCVLAAFSNKIYNNIDDSIDTNERIAQYKDFKWKETDLTPVVTQTRITFFTPPNKNGRGSSYSGKFYLISDQYNLVTSTNLTAFPSFVKESAVTNGTQAYNFTADNEKFQIYADFVQEFCDSDNSEYILYGPVTYNSSNQTYTSKYYMDFFHYPISGKEGQTKLNGTVYNK